MARTIRPATIRLRGGKWYVDYREPHTGRRRQRSLGFAAADEVEARKALRLLQVELDKRAAAGPPQTVRVYGAAWVKARKDRGVVSAVDDASVLGTHVYPVLGDVELTKVTGVMVRDLVLALRETKTAKGEPLAPRTIHNIFGTLSRLFADAVAEEKIERNPCAASRRVLPKMCDADPLWREGAVYTADEVERLISAESIPLARRLWYAIEALAGLRAGEVSALTFGDLDATTAPLHRLNVRASYSVKAKRLKGTKTGVYRAVPIHARLAALLAEWRLSGYEALTGQRPTPDAILIPASSSPTKHRRPGSVLKRLVEDLQRFGLRQRGQHDLRATFDSLLTEAGVDRDTVGRLTHTSRRDVLDGYLRLSWPHLCSAVAKLPIAASATRRGRVVKLRASVGTADALDEDEDDEVANSCCSRVTVAQARETTGGLSQGARGAYPSAAPSLTCADVPNRAETGAPTLSLVPGSVPAYLPVSQVSHAPEAPDEGDAVLAQLVEAARAWGESHDVRALRRALLALAAGLD